jgi:hypothetical protein
MLNSPCRMGIPGEPDEIILTNGIVANLSMMLSHRAGESRCSAQAALFVDAGMMQIVARDILRRCGLSECESHAAGPQVHWRLPK